MADGALIAPPGSGLIVHQPELMRQEQAKAEAIIDYGIKIRDWPLVAKAIEAKIEQQREFVEWWTARVSVRLNAGTQLTAEQRSTLSRTDAETHTGIRNQQVSRWRNALTNVERYLEQQIRAAYKKAGLEPLDNHRAEGTGENEWFTPGKYIEAARRVLGAIDLDPASNPLAQEWIKAANYFTRDDDGLSQEWHGRIWLNPPYARAEIMPFIEKLVTEIRGHRVTAAILLTHNYTDTEWFHLAMSAAAAVCFTRGRVRFVDDLGNESAPTQGQAFIYYGEHDELFTSEFGEFGAILRPIKW